MAERKNEINKTPQIAVDDGIEEVELCNKRGDVIGKFAFRPADMGIIDRWEELIKNFDHIIEPLENVGAINADGTADADDLAGIDALREARRRLCEALDRALGCNTSDGLFGVCHPFSLVNGHMFCENVLDAVSGYMGSRFDEEFAKVNRRQIGKANQYIQGIRHGNRTGKHAGGTQ